MREPVFCRRETIPGFSLNKIVRPVVTAYYSTRETEFGQEAAVTLT